MTAPSLDVRNRNALWGSVFVETLARCGVRRVVVSPGSRSTPLAFAFARHPAIEAVPVLDERSAAFFALGLAKRTGVPSVLLCTSGTAGANYYPAVIEAHESGVPLLVITADRPPEMRASASGQTINQHRLYGVYAVFEHELAVPELDLGLLRYLRQTVAHAVERSLGPVPGPVHLNAPFRDPLAPVGDGGAAAGFAAGIDWDLFFESLTPPAPVTLESEVPPLSPGVPGVIIAGPASPTDPGAYAKQVGELARRLGWPVLADGLSPCRGHASLIPGLITRYDAVLRSARVANDLRPERVLCVGEWPTSKVLRSWLEASQAPVLFATQRADNRDSLHGVTRRVVASLERILRAVEGNPAEGGYAAAWAKAEKAALESLDGRLSGETGLVEPKAAWILGRSLPQGSSLFVANSMPVRDVEYLWPATDRKIRVFFNRGANGIDGTLSTALGVAHGGPPCTLLTGDLALLHDSNGFLIGRELKGSLSVVLVNNSGGGIFEHLPVAGFPEAFERFFGTPQQVDFAALATAHGVAHTRIRDWDQFETLIGNPPGQGIRLLELITDRKHDAAWRKAAFDSALKTH